MPSDAAHPRKNATRTHTPVESARGSGALALSARSKGISLLVLLALWAVIAQLLADPVLAPGPLAVARAMLAGAIDGPLLRDLWATLFRVLAAFVLAMGFGTALGLLFGLSRRVDQWFGPWLSIALNIPALVVIVLCYLWIGLNEWAAITAVALNKIPMVAVMLREGVRARDTDLSDMAQVYAMSPFNRLRHIVLPQLAPYLLGAARTGIALIWKIVLVVEFLGRSNGIGFRIHLDFQMFDITGVLANALAFTAIMLAVDWGILAPLARRAAQWRRE